MLLHVAFPRRKIRLRHPAILFLKMFLGVTLKLREKFDQFTIRCALAIGNELNELFVRVIHRAVTQT